MHGDASSRFQANLATLDSGEVARTDPAMFAARGRQSFVQGARPGMHVNRSLGSVLIHTSGNSTRRLPTDCADTGIGFANNYVPPGDGGQNTNHHPAVTPSSVAGCRRTESGLWTLEDNENRTAHSMGPAAEQDTYVLDSIPSGILSSPDDIDADMIQVYAGTKYPWDPPVHFCLLQDEFAPHDDAVKQAASDAIESLVVIMARFLSGSISSTSTLCYQFSPKAEKKDISLKGPLPFQQHQLVHYATDSLQRELDSPKLAKLQASLLLLHVKPNHVDSIEHPRTWTSTAQAVATAQMIGLHQDAERWSLPAWEKRLRRKFWWATYVADVWSAVCHGNPPHIYPASFNTSAITMEDLRNDEDLSEDLQMMVDPLSHRFQVAPAHARSRKSDRPVKQRHVLLKSPSKSERQLTVETVPLHLSYYAYTALLFRALMSPATAEARNDPSSNLCRWFGTAVAEFQAFTRFMDEITSEDLQGFWGRHARSQLILCGNFIIYLFLQQPKSSDIQSAWSLVQTFRSSLHRLDSQAYDVAKLSIRPVFLRIESFFSQGPELI
ncbi:hypothetical protein LA080_003747 [Diaporthe eres]|nr:hypothetical protein LA080_003747 [Diaporthe eres]